jgi:hypothetical protein
MKNRFHLEQEIIDCWKICDDLQQSLNECDSDAEFRRICDGLFRLYNMKFDVLWDTFKQSFSIDEYSE